MEQNQSKTDDTGENVQKSASNSDNPRMINSLAACASGHVVGSCELCAVPNVGGAIVSAPKGYKQSDPVYSAEGCLYPTWEKLTAPSAKYTFDRENHVHFLDGRPLHGTSTVVKGAESKDGLLYWSAELASVVCLESGEHIPTIGAEYDALVATAKTQAEKSKGRRKLERKYPIFKKARYAHRDSKEKAAGPGTDMHAEMEKYVKYCIYENKGEPYCAFEFESPEVARFSDWACLNVSEFLWSEGHCYSSRLWIGGICDCGAILKAGRIAILDFKSSKESFYGYFVQMSGYAIAIVENGLFTHSGQAMCISKLIPNRIDALVSIPFGSPDDYEFPVLPADHFTLEFEGALANYKRKQWFEAEMKKWNPTKVKYKKSF